MAVRLDHAVINVLTAMDAAVERFAALGFAPTARGYHSLGSINHLMMFEAGYLELVGLEPGAKKVREEVATSPIGLNGLVFTTDDARALHQRLADAGVPVLAPTDFTRPVTIAGIEHTAAFTTVRVEPGYVHGGRVYYCQHHTPERVWHRPWLAQPNGADGIAEFVVAVDDPCDEAARYETLLDGVRFAPPQPDGTRCATLGDFRLTLSTAAAYIDRYGDAGCSRVQAAALPGGGCMGALVVRTASLATLRTRLARDLHPTPYRDEGERIVVPARELWDCTLEFIGHAPAYR